jgi:hypothetical protein
MKSGEQITETFVHSGADSFLVSNEQGRLQTIKKDDVASFTLSSLNEGIYCKSSVIASIPATPSAPQSTIPASAEAPTPSSTLTNKDVLELHAAGLSAEIITAKIKASSTKFDISVSALQSLKTQGLPDPVILAMVEASTSTTTKTSDVKTADVESPVADSDRPQPDRWRGLVIDQSTPEDAMSILGKPESDKIESMRVYRIDKWTSAVRHKKVFRKLKFKKPQGVDSASLYFMDNKLVMIELDTSNLFPNSLPHIYGIEFTPMVESIDVAMNPQDFERNQGKIYPKSFPTVYSMVAVSKRSFVSAMVGNSSFGSVFRRSMGVGDAAGDYPGKVILLQIISRALENRDGADALK